MGKLSTPKNLFIKLLTNIDFSSDSKAQIKRYCAVISNWREINKNESCISNLNEYDRLMKESKNSKNSCGIFNNKMELIMALEGLGSWLNDNVEDFDKFEIYLPDLENSILDHCIIYDNPPIGYSVELDKFVVEQCYKSCYLYVFVINADESILEEEMKIIELLNKRNVIELKFIISYSRDLSKEDYIKIENDYLNRIKVITSQFPGIIIISGHGYKSYGKEPKDSLKDAIPYENRIKDLGKFIHKEPVIELFETHHYDLILIMF